MAFEVRQSEARLGDHAERTFAAGHELREVDARAVGGRHVDQVVARHVAPQLREGARDFVAASGGDLARELVRLARPSPGSAQRVELGAGGARRTVDDAAAKHHLEVDHVLAPVLPCTRDPSPLASVATIPPSVARLEGERLAAK